jgi:phycocyanobilin lyase beta subunit
VSGERTINGTTGELIEAIERADTAEALVRATQRLAFHGEALADPAGIACLLQVLNFNNPGAAVAAVEGLIRRGSAAVEPLLQGIDPHNYGARAWAIRALAGIGDVRGLEILEEALATDVGPSVRRAAARGLGGLDLSGLEPARRLGTRERILRALEEGGQDGEWVVRYAVVAGLETLAAPLPAEDAMRGRATAAVGARSDPDLEDTAVVRLRAGLALQRLSFSPSPR